MPDLSLSPPSMSKFDFPYGRFVNFPYDRRVDFPPETLAPPIQNIPPNTVGTTTAWATLNPNQRKIFYANGRFWAFYSNGTNIVYATSTDGETWTSPATIRACAGGERFSIWFDGTYFHYAYANGTPIYYRRGTANADGSITWSALEQTVSTDYNYARNPFVSVDSSGYVWIAYRDYDGAGHCPRVIKSGNNDGTWGTTPSGFPYLLNSSYHTAWRPSIIPLTAGKMLAIYVYNTLTVRSKRWDGSTWGSERATASPIREGPHHSAVAQGDDVHLVFLHNTTYDIIYSKYTYTSDAWGAEETLRLATTASSAPILCRDPGTDDLYCFWANSPVVNHIYYKKNVGGTWDTDPTDWVTETQTITSAGAMTGFYQVYSDCFGILYMTLPSPSNVRFAGMLNV